jgi:hypothetical protein
MSTTERSPGKLGKLAVLACAAGILGSSLAGCSPGMGRADVSPEVQAKAKENFKKRTSDSAEKPKGRKTTR